MMVQTALRTALATYRRSSKQHEVLWRYALNARSTLRYRLEREVLRGEPARVLSELNESGIAVTSVDALLGADSLFNELTDAVDAKERDLAAPIALARAAVDTPDASGEKRFLFQLLGNSPAVAPEGIWARFALQRPVVDIANAYFGMYTRLTSCNVWRNFVTRLPARDSQLWHRDPEDRYILKMFVCLGDVDDGAGPFSYARGTHAKGTERRRPAYLFTQGATTRSDDRQMAEIVSRDRWRQGVGPKGTIIFADTAGFHKGGLADRHDRLMYVSCFLSPGAGLGGLTTRVNSKTGIPSVPDVSAGDLGIGTAAR